MTDLSGYSDSELLALYAMPSLKTQESSNRPGVLGPQTRYGRAEGLTQMLPATAKATAERMGMPWRPEMMRAKTPEAAEYQETLGRGYLQEGIEKTGNLGDGLRYYHGGPDRRQWGPKTNGYADQVTARLTSGPAPAAADLSGMSDQELMALYRGQQGQAPPAPAPRQGPSGISTPMGRGYANPADVAALSTEKPKSFTLGLLESIRHADDRIGAYSPANLIPGLREKREAASPRLAARIDERKQTQTPGPLGHFMGDIAIAGGLSGPLSPLVGGAVSGGVLGDSKDMPGLAKDMAGGALLSRVAAAGSDALQLGARHLLSKAPNVLKPAELPGAVKAAYKAVDDSGFSFGARQVAGLADDFAKSVKTSALSKSAKDDAASIIGYTRQLAKGDLSLSQLEKLRGDIYSAMVAKGGDTARLGTAFRQQIDTLIDTVDNGLVREARGLNARLKKAEVVTNASKSADRAAEKDYGGDYGRKLKDRLNPLVDEMKPNRNLRGGTPDEMKALDRIVRGTKVQNAASTAGGMLDPRRLGGKILTGITGTGGGVSAPATAGLSLLLPAAQMGLGFGLTGIASKTARSNLDELVKLIAAGGSKQALARVPTKPSAATEKTIARVLRPVAVTSAVPAAAAAKPKKSQGR